MAILHKNISAEGDIHNPKWFSGANNGDVAWRNELGVLESTDELVLPAALNFVDGSVAPPTSNSGDIYVLSSGASVNAGWGTVALGDWVRYNGTTWNVITPQKSTLCYNETLDKLFSYSGSVWAEVGGGGGTDVNAVHVNAPSEISGITAKATPTASDLLIIEDVADGNNKKKITIGDLPSSGGGGIVNVTSAEKAGLSPSIGDFVYDTDLKRLQRYSGSLWVGVANGYGVLSLTSSIGEPTFYTSYTLAIAAASTGDNITQYGNINDSSNTTVIINKAININLNGFTYTNSSTGNSDSISINITGVKVKILNGVIKRTGGTYNQFQSRALIAAANTDIELTGTTITANNGMVLSSSGSSIKILNGLFISTGLTGSQFSVLSTAQIIAASFESTGINKFQGILYNVKATSTIGYNQLQGSTSEARFCEFRVTDPSGGAGLNVDTGKVFYCDCFTAATSTLYAGLSLGGANSEAWYSLGYADNTHGIKVGSSVPKGIYNCTGINVNGNRYGVLLGNITEVLDSTFISVNGAGAVSCNGSDILIDSCNFKTESGLSYKRGFFDNGTSGNVRLYNCLIETAGSGAGNDSIKFSNGRTVYLAKNRIKGGTGITNPNGNSQTTTPDSVGNIILD